MGSSRTLLCSTAFLLFLLSSASEDEHLLEQREVTFDLVKLMQEMQQLDDSFMVQKEADLTDLFDAGEFPIDQVMVHPAVDFDILSRIRESSPGVLTPRGRHLAHPPSLDYPVQFPLGRPTADNLQAICLHGDRRPRYPPSYFPSSSFGKLKRRAKAVNKAESWFSTCCKGNQTWEGELTLCCATQAWERSIESFCKEDLSVKDRIDDCCLRTGRDRLNCFHGDAPNPNYAPTEELPVPPLSSITGFNFDPDTCLKDRMVVVTPYSVRGNRKRKVKKPATSQNIDIIFPPGRPTADAIESLCGNQKLRPLYSIKCLPSSGYEGLARQAKTINRMEKRFKQCCRNKQGALDCADQKWREELDRFCSSANGEQVDFQCCSSGDGENDRHSCFQNLSPDPHYNLTFAAEGLSLSKVCDTHKIIKNKFPVGFPLKSLVSQCCPLLDQDKTICFTEKLQEMSESLCTSRKASSLAVRRCCRAPSSQEAPQCISQILVDAVTKATNVSRQKKKKMCPLS